MNDSNATELLPCPFCGGEAKLIRADHPSYTQHSEGWYVICGCGASLGYHGVGGEFETYGDFPHELCAVKAWNTRTEQTIAATLGAGECENQWANIEGAGFCCSECNFTVNFVQKEFNFCPNCGKAVKR